LWGAPILGLGSNHYLQIVDASFRLQNAHIGLTPGFC
jgi:hypothetical protein